MAEVNPPLYVQTGSYPASADRLLLAALAGYGSGIFASGDLAVNAQVAPNMSVRVAAGAAIVQGTHAANQGAYFARNDAEKTVAIAAADPTNPRKDLVVARVRDAEYGDAQTAWALEVVQGVPAAAPAEPVLPASSYKLAVVTVPAGAATIVAGNVADARALNTIVSVADSVITAAKIATGAVQSKHFDPVTGYAEASAALALTAAWQDISGLSTTLNLGGQVAGMEALCIGFVQFDPTSAATVKCRARLLVDGAAQLKQIACSTTEDAGSFSVGQSWRVTGLSAANHTFKLQAQKTADSAGNANAHVESSLFVMTYKG
jgi:hypothetical protein